MAYNFGECVNLVLRPLNEVELTASTFATTVGFHSSVKDYVNAAVWDIYTEQDNEWSFGWSTNTFTTTIGVTEYSKAAGLTTIDWESFRLKKQTLSITSLTQSSGTATATTSVNHGLLAGDVITVSGASPSAYNGQFVVLTVTPTTFTYTVDSATSSPATGTIVTYSGYSQTYLDIKSYDDYRKYDMVVDANNVLQEDFNQPTFVVRKPDNNFIITPKPDREYVVEYEGFSMPAVLTNFTDVPVIPEVFKQCIVDKALHYAYMFRDNIEQADRAQDRYEKNNRKIRRLLIPMDTYARFE